MRRRRTRAAVGLVVTAAIFVALVGLRHGARATSAAGPTRAGAVRAAVDALYALSIPAITNREQFEAEVLRVSAPGAERRVESSFDGSQPSLRAAFTTEP